MDNYKNKHYKNNKNKRSNKEYRSHTNVIGSTEYLHEKLMEEKAAVQAEKARLRAEILERNEIRDRIRNEIMKKQESDKNINARRSWHSKEREGKDWDKITSLSRHREPTLNDHRRNDVRRPKIEGRRDDCYSPEHFRDKTGNQDPGDKEITRERILPHNYRRLDELNVPKIVQKDNSRRPVEHRDERKRKYLDEGRRHALEPERKRMRSPSRDYQREPYAREEHRPDLKDLYHDGRRRRSPSIHLIKEPQESYRKDPHKNQEPRVNVKEIIVHDHSPPFESRLRDIDRSSFIREETHEEMIRHEILEIGQSEENRFGINPGFDPKYIDRPPRDFNRPSFQTREDDRHYIQDEICDTRIEYESNKLRLQEIDRPTREIAIANEIPPLIKHEIRGRPLDNDRQNLRREFRDTSMDKDRPSFMSLRIEGDRLERSSPTIGGRSIGNDRPIFTKEGASRKSIDKDRLHYVKEDFRDKRQYPPKELGLNIEDRVRRNSPPFKGRQSISDKAQFIRDVNHGPHGFGEPVLHDKNIRKSPPPFRIITAGDTMTTFNSQRRDHAKIRQPERLGHFSPQRGQRQELQDYIRSPHDNREIELERDEDIGQSSSEFRHRSIDNQIPPYIRKESSMQTGGEYMARELNERERIEQSFGQRPSDDFRPPLQETRPLFHQKEELRISTRVSGTNYDFIRPTSSSQIARPLNEQYTKKGIESNVISNLRGVNSGLSVSEGINPKHPIQHIIHQQPPQYLRVDSSNVRGPLRSSPTFRREEDCTTTRGQLTSQEPRFNSDEGGAQYRSLRMEPYINKEILASGNCWRSGEECWKKRDIRLLLQDQQPTYTRKEVGKTRSQIPCRKSAFNVSGENKHIPPSEINHQTPRGGSHPPHMDDPFLYMDDWRRLQPVIQEQVLLDKDNDSSIPPCNLRYNAASKENPHEDYLYHDENMTMNRFILIRPILEGKNLAVAIMREDKEPINMPLAKVIYGQILILWKEKNMAPYFDNTFGKTFLMFSGYFIITTKTEEAFNWLMTLDLGSFTNVKIRIIRRSQIARVKVTVILEGFGNNDPSVPHEPLQNIIFQNDYRKGLNFHMWTLDKFFKTAKGGRLHILIDVDSAVTLRDDPHLNFELSTVKVLIPDKLVLEPIKGYQLKKLITN